MHFFPKITFICIRFVSFWRYSPMLLSWSLLILLILSFFLSPFFLSQLLIAEPSRRPACLSSQRLGSRLTWVRHPCWKAVECFQIALQVCQYWKWRIALSWPWKLSILELDSVSGDMSLFESFFQSLNWIFGYKAVITSHPDLVSRKDLLLDGNTLKISKEDSEGSSSLKSLKKANEQIFMEGFANC